MQENLLSDRVKRMKTSATLAMAAAARELSQAGVDVVTLSAGEPDFATPTSICEVGKKSIDDGNTHYAPVRGTRNMISAMREKFLRDQKVGYGDDEVLCTVGAKSALHLAIESVVNDGDEVIIFAPYWVSYFEQIRLAGGKPVVVQCKSENNFMPTSDDLAGAITSKTKAVILNSPSNPSGAVISGPQLHILAEKLLGTNIWLISDEIYEKLVFQGQEHVSPASISDDMRSRTIVISGASKGYAMTGWRVGVVGGNAEIISAMAKLQGQQTTSNPEFVQDAAAFAFREDSEVRSELVKMLRAYDDRREACLKRFLELPKVEVFKSTGAFYIWADFSAYVGVKIGNELVKDDIDLARRMLVEANVACVPGTPFGTSGYLRMSIASSLEDIEKAMDRIINWLKK